MNNDEIRNDEVKATKQLKSGKKAIHRLLFEHRENNIPGQ